MDAIPSSIDTLRTRLAARKGKWPIVAERAGVPISTLRKVAQGVILNPRINTADGLRRALDELDAEEPLQ